MEPFDPAWLGYMSAQELSERACLLMPCQIEGMSVWFRNGTFFLWRAVIIALCHKRDTQNFDLSLTALVDYLRLERIEDLFIEGFHIALTDPENAWPAPYALIKDYLDMLPGYSIPGLLRRHQMSLPHDIPEPLRDLLIVKRQEPGHGALEQHSYWLGYLLDPLMALKQREAEQGNQSKKQL